MNDLPIRFKLMLLAGVPVVGALALSLVIVTGATEQVRKAESLGSVENLAELSVIISELVHELQMERAHAALVLGTAERRRIAAEVAPADEVISEALREAGLSEEVAGAGPMFDAQAEDAGIAVGAGTEGDAPGSVPSRGAGDAGARGGLAAGVGAGGPAPVDALRAQFRRTDETQARMDAFLAKRDLSRLPRRLAEQLRAARAIFEARHVIRTQTRRSGTALRDVTEHYDSSLAPLIASTAALTELVDDGELLRVITSLVALMKVKEADSAEHAVVANALSAGEFAPGSYRHFVTLTTAGASYADVFRTLATGEQVLDMQGLGGEVAEALRIRALVSDWVEGQSPAEPALWFRVQAAKVTYLHDVEANLNARVRALALSRIADTRGALAVGVGLAAVVLVVSVVLGWVISFGVSRSVLELRAASQRIGHGDLETRFVVRSRDELGQLGGAFNDMARELSAARQAEADQARMAGELEIAARLQSALLPPDPRHPGFEFAGRMIPAAEVGGDFYDVLSEGEQGALWLTIGDVSNHGLDSGLVMLMAQSAFATQFQANAEAGADDVIRGVNRVLCENITRRLKDNKYLTAQLLQHRGDGRFDCAGGHEPPVIYRRSSGEAEIASAVGPWLGIMGQLAQVPVSHMQLDAGDVLCLYSDGITEAKNAAGELFDTARLAGAMAEALRDNDDLDAVADAIIARVRAHAEGRDDDWTMLLVRRS